MPSNRKLHIQRKSPLSLIEVGIAFGIMVVLVSTLFFAFRSASFLSFKLSKVKAVVIERHVGYQRLLNLFAHLKSEAFADEENERVSLLFENEIDPELIYFGDVKGDLYLDETNSFILETFPSKSGAPSRKEVLFTHVKEASWDFKTPGVVTLTLTYEKSPPATLAFFLPHTLHAITPEEKEETLEERRT